MTSIVDIQVSDETVLSILESLSTGVISIVVAEKSFASASETVIMSQGRDAEIVKQISGGTAPGSKFK
jgi:hypothetical protein